MTDRFAVSLTVLLVFGASGCAANQQVSDEIAEAPFVTPVELTPSPPADFTPAKSGALPGGVEVQVGWIPDGYVQTEGRGSFFTLGQPSEASEAPSAVRTWMREDGWSKERGGLPSAIAIIVASFSLANPVVSPRQIAAGGEVLVAVRNTTEVFMRVQATGALDVRWTEDGLDVKVLLMGSEWDVPSTSRLVSSITLIRS